MPEEMKSDIGPDDLMTYLLARQQTLERLVSVLLGGLPVEALRKLNNASERREQRRKDEDLFSPQTDRALLMAELGRQQGLAATVGEALRVKEVALKAQQRTPRPPAE